MATLSEVKDSGSYAGPLRQGQAVLGQNQEVMFQKYSRVVLPLDGYVFWQPTTQLKASGIFSYGQQLEVSEDETIGVGDVTFITSQKVVEFSGENDSIYVGRAGDMRYAFSRQDGYLGSQNEWHYAGRSLYPALASQLLDPPLKIDKRRAIVSNSLPIWLSLNSYAPPYPGFTTGVTLYPADLVEPNIAPPYGSVAIDGPEPLQAMPYLDATMSSDQLVCDRVRVTLYGLQSDEAIAFQNAVLQYCQDVGALGLMAPVDVVDERRSQPELQAIAMKKTLEFRVSYHQTRAASIARQLIESVIVTVDLREQVA